MGALAVARLCESLGTPFALGGVAWERFAIDPRPGPRPIEEIRGGERLDGAAVLADAATTTDDGVAFAEAGVADFLGTQTALIDITRGVTGASRGIAAAMKRLHCDLLLGVDVGGDVLGRGDEAGLASPLCDAVMVSAMERCARRISWGEAGSKSRTDVAWHRRGVAAKTARTADRITVQRLEIRI